MGSRHSATLLYYLLPRAAIRSSAGYTIDTHESRFLHGVGAVGLIDAHRARRANAVAVQEDHDLTDDLLLGPGRNNAARPHRANAIHLPQAVGLRLDDVEHLLPEGAQEFLGIDRANAPDHARSKVFLDAFDRSGRGGLEEPGLNCWPWVRSFTQSPAAM